MATKNLGTVGMTPAGEYIPGETYKLLAVVSYDGESYLSRKENNTSLPTVEPDWQKIAGKGEGYLGILTPSSTIPTTGSWYGTVLAAGTFNNVSPAITVDAADFDVQNGTPNNEVRIIITEGVATKDVKRVKGDSAVANPVFDPDNNTEAPTMKAVADYVDVEPVISTVQLFDKNNYNADTSFNSSNTNAPLTGGAVTPYYNIPDGQTHVSFSGLGTSAARRIAWMTDVDGGGSLISVTTTALSSATILIPATAKSFRFFFQRPEDGDVTGTFMLNFGMQAPYEPYETIKEIVGFEFAQRKPNTVKSAYAVLNGVSPTVNASNWYKKTPVVADVALKGNSGLGYDLKRNLFVVAEYNTTISSKILVFRNSDLVEGAVSTPYRTIDLSTILDHIQGVTWDFVDDTYLALGTKKGELTGTTNSIVVKVSPIGTVLDIFELGDNITVQVGMIDILIDGNIVIKPNLGSYAYIFNRNYALITRIVLIGEEGIAVNKFNGDIWCADSKFTVKKYDKNFVELATYTFNTYNNESAGSNIEGMAILPDGSLVISADAFLHGGTTLGNALFFFDFEQTVNKRRYFYLPNGIGEYKDLKGEYVTEIIKPVAAVTSVVVESDKVNRKFYRSADTLAAISAAAFSSTLTSNTYFQTKITI